MKNITLLSYALLLIIGGIIGHQAAGSKVSLIASVTSALLLFLALFLQRYNQKAAQNLALSVLSLLTLFFIYRWGYTEKFLPAGLLCLITSGVLAVTYFKGKKG